MTGAKRRQRARRKLIVAPALGSALALALGWWPLALGMLVLVYLANELLLADHIFYDPRSDYDYEFDKGRLLEHRWVAGALEVVPPDEPVDTLFLRASVHASFTGRILDPWVEINDGAVTTRQYFERGVAGYRYLNLSALVESIGLKRSLVLTTRYCRIDIDSTELFGFANQRLDGRRVLIIAPHADDAEIAAFGLYSNAEHCSIVTVTAGETDSEQFHSWLGVEESTVQAAQFKGEVRAMDGLAAALWGGLPQERYVSLGYGCMQLEVMREQPGFAVTSPFSGLADTRPYRRWNRIALPGDKDGLTSWDNLLADLTCIVADYQPDVIVTAHPQLDKHRDHINATVAIWQAVRRCPELHVQWYLYVNHLESSQHYPFGPAHSELGLPPGTGTSFLVEAVHSLALSTDTQRRKALSLDLMHDLKRPIKWKKWLRRRLQWLFIGRGVNPYGEDDFFRKSVRSSEVFFVASAASMADLMEPVDEVLTGVAR